MARLRHEPDVGLRHIRQNRAKFAHQPSNVNQVELRNFKVS